MVCLRSPAASRLFVGVVSLGNSKKRQLLQRAQDWVAPVNAHRRGLPERFLWCLWQCMSASLPATGSRRPAPSTYYTCQNTTNSTFCCSDFLQSNVQQGTGLGMGGAHQGELAAYMLCRVPCRVPSALTPKWTLPADNNITTCILTVKSIGGVARLQNLGVGQVHEQDKIDACVNGATACVQMSHKSEPSSQMILS